MPHLGDIGGAVIASAITSRPLYSWGKQPMPIYWIPESLQTLGSEEQFLSPTVNRIWSSCPQPIAIPIELSRFLWWTFEAAARECQKNCLQDTWREDVNAEMETEPGFGAMNKRSPAFCHVAPYSQEDVHWCYSGDKAAMLRDETPCSLLKASLHVSEDHIVSMLGVEKSRQNTGMKRTGSK